MPDITFILPNGMEQSCTAREGLSLMEVALQNAVPGIIAECNGSAACATCHIVVDDALASMLDPISEHENDMLDFTAAQRAPGSRLSCQIKVDGRVDGATIRIPAEM
jgi:2Fe-2S ferredoxin